MVSPLEISVSNYVSLDMVLSVDLPLIRGDLSQISQVLMNLITNASEAIGEHPGRIMIAMGTVVLSSEECAEWRTSWDVSEGVYVFIDVSDNGCGMAASTCEQIFEPFFTTESSGTGLGLYISRELCESNQAHLTYSRHAEGGSCFRIIFAHPDRITL